MIETIDAGILWTIGGPAVAAGVFGGVLAGLLGIGGGVVIVPALYVALSLTDMDRGQIMQVAVGTSLATIVFTSISSAWGHYRKGAIDFALLKLWGPSLLAGVLIGALLGGLVSGLVMIGVFATVVLVVGLDMVLRGGGGTDRARDFPRWIWAILGVIAGGLSAMMGIGGGTVCVPLLSVLGYDIRRAVGTSAAIGFIIGLPGAATYIVTGWGHEGLLPLSLGYVNLAIAAIIVPLTMTFSWAGVAIAHRIPRRALRLTFGIFLLATSVKMFLDLFGAV